MSAVKFPRAGSRGLALLRAMLPGSGTLHQLRERSGLDFDMQASDEILREILGTLVRNNAAKFDGHSYSVTPEARTRLTGSAAVGYVGQVATAHYRGPGVSLPVRIVRGVQA